MLRPSVEGELVFDGVGGNVDCQFVHVVADRGHRVAIAAPAIEGTVDVDGTKGRAVEIAHVHPEGHAVLAGAVVDGGVSIVVGGSAVHAALDVGGALGAAVVTDQGQGDRGIDQVETAVGKPVVGIVVTRSAHGKFFLSGPSVDGEFVFGHTGGEWQGGGPDAIGIVVGERIAIAAPSVEGAVDVRDVSRLKTGLAHVHLEGDVVEAGPVVVGRRGAVVGGIVVRTTKGGFGLLVTGQATAVGVGRGRTRSREAVGVGGGIGDGSTGCSGLGVIDEVFLGSPVVDHVLVLHITGRNAHGDAVHAVSVLIGQGVVGLGSAPTAPGASHVHRGERLAAAGHVHGERGRRGQAVAVTVEVGGCIGAGAVIFSGRVVIVAGIAVGTPRAAARHGLEAKGALDQLGLVTVGENLDVKLSAKVAIRGGLGDEHLLVTAGQSVGTAGQDVPSTSNG